MQEQCLSEDACKCYDTGHQRTRVSDHLSKSISLAIVCIQIQSSTELFMHIKPCVV